MAEKRLFTIRDFSKGVNNHIAPNLIPENALTDAENAVIGSGYVSKRAGFGNYSVNNTGTTELTWNDVGNKTWSEL